MIRIRRGKVIAITAKRPGVTEILVECEGAECGAVNYDLLSGRVHPGDEVLLNTTAVHKALGTGGYHFVIANLSVSEYDAPETGHIMKLRYTPLQLKVLAAEEEDSPLSARIKNIDGLDGLPVVIAGLHSQLPAFAAALAYLRPGTNLAYLMTDGAALPAFFSRIVNELRRKRLLQSVITCGHAFGGDYEAVNMYSGLITARALRADVVIAGMGPGIVGTGTMFGHTGIEQGQLINAVFSLHGRPVVIPRINFADPRVRQQGISHHTITMLQRVALAPASVTIPVLPPAKNKILWNQIQDSELEKLHRVVTEEGSSAIEGMARYGLKVTSMGRSPAEIPEFFLAVGAAAAHTVKLLDRPETDSP